MVSTVSFFHHSLLTTHHSFIPRHDRLTTHYAFMPERHIQLIRTDDAAAEEPAATRERLKAHFPPAAARRMTQLGMLVSAVLNELNPARDDAIIYATKYGEGRTLETFLDSFPAASPIGFQTSIHPGAVQQGMIRLARSVTEFFPMAGADYLPGQSLLAAMLSPAPRVILCGGEERGTWLTPIDGASTRSFAYGMTFTHDPRHAMGNITLTPTDGPAEKMSSAAWFDILHARKNFTGFIIPGWRVKLTFASRRG